MMVTPLLAPAATPVELELILNAISARATPTELRPKPNKTRRLKKASREVDPVFMFSICMCVNCTETEALDRSDRDFVVSQVVDVS